MTRFASVRCASTEHFKVEMLSPAYQTSCTVHCSLHAHPQSIYQLQHKRFITYANVLLAIQHKSSYTNYDYCKIVVTRLPIGKTLQKVRIREIHFPCKMSTFCDLGHISVSVCRAEHDEKARKHSFAMVLHCSRPCTPIPKEPLIKWHFGNAQLFRLARSGTQALCTSFFEAGVTIPQASGIGNRPQGGSRRPRPRKGRVNSSVLDCFKKNEGTPPNGINQLFPNKHNTIRQIYSFTWPVPVFPAHCLK